MPSCELPASRMTASLDVFGTQIGALRWRRALRCARGLCRARSYRVAHKQIECGQQRNKCSRRIQQALFREIKWWRASLPVLKGERAAFVKSPRLDTSAATHLNMRILLSCIANDSGDWLRRG